MGMEVLRMPFAGGDDTTAIRHAAREVLADQPPELVDDALLVISELTQNVIQHAGGTGLLVISRRAENVLIEVFDKSQVVPLVRDPDPRRPGGRGLYIVAAITAAWGTSGDSEGKVVWAELTATA